MEDPGGTRGNTGWGRAVTGLGSVSGEDTLLEFLEGPAGVW